MDNAGPKANVLPPEFPHANNTKSRFPPDDLLLSLKKLTFCLQEWEHDPETMPKAYDQQPRHVQMLMDLIKEHEEEKPYG